MRSRKGSPVWTMRPAKIDESGHQAAAKGALKSAIASAVQAPSRKSRPSSRQAGGRPAGSAAEARIAAFA